MNMHSKSGSKSQATNGRWDRAPTRKQVQALAERKVRLVALTTPKACYIKKHNALEFSVDDCLKSLSTGWRPGYSNVVGADVDDGDFEYVVEWAGDALFAVLPSTSGNPNKRHVIFWMHDALELNNHPFEIEDEVGLKVKGDLRTDALLALNKDSAEALIEALDQGEPDPKVWKRPEQVREFFKVKSGGEIVDPDYDPDAGKELTKAAVPKHIGRRLLKPKLAQRYKELKFIGSALKEKGFSFNSVLDVIGPFIQSWPDENGQPDDKFENEHMRRHLNLVWVQAKDPASEFDNDTEIEIAKAEEALADSKSKKEDFKPKNHKVEENRDDYDDPLWARLDELNAGNIAVVDGGQFRVYNRQYDHVVKRPIWVPWMKSSFADFHADEQFDYEYEKDKFKRMSLGHIWLRSPSKQKYTGIVLDPQNLPQNAGKLNLWEGFAVKGAPGDWSLMQEHIRETLCLGIDEREKYVLRWVAYLLQKPWLVPETALVFRGGEGVGKGIFGRALLQVAGRHGVTVANSHHLSNNFNAHLRDAIYVFADEAFWGGDKSREGTLKQLITEPAITFEPKGKDAVQGVNMVHLLMASNEDWVVPTSIGQRRFFITDVSDKHKGDTVYFQRLTDQLRNGGLEAMVHDLMEMDLGDWRPTNDVPRTEAEAEQKEHSLRGMDRSLLNFLDRGAIEELFLGTGDEAASWNGSPVMLGTKQKQRLLDIVNNDIRIESHVRDQVTLRKLGNRLEELGMEYERDMEVRFWKLPPLEVMQGALSAEVGRNLFE